MCIRDSQEERELRVPDEELLQPVEHRNLLAIRRAAGQFTRSFRGFVAFVHVFCRNNLNGAQHETSRIPAASEERALTRHPAPMRFARVRLRQTQEGCRHISPAGPLTCTLTSPSGHSNRPQAKFGRSALCRENATSAEPLTANPSRGTIGFPGMYLLSNGKLMGLSWLRRWGPRTWWLNPLQ